MIEGFGIVFGLFGVMFLAIIGVYGWTFKVSKDTDEKLGLIYETVNGHMQSASIHTDETKFVKADVCAVVHENLSRDVSEIKKDVKSLLSARVD